MPDPSNAKKRQSNDLILLAFAAAIGLIFAVGLELVSPPMERGVFAEAIHILTPPAVMGLVGLVFARQIFSRVRSRAFVYVLFASLGGLAALLALFALDRGGVLAPEAYYIAIWGGIFAGAVMRLAIDEAMIRHERKQ